MTEPVAGKQYPHVTDELREQKALIDKWCFEALDIISYIVTHNRERILLTARNRLEVGFEKYGQEGMFSFSVDKLWAEAIEELADAVNYLAVMQEKREAGL